MFDIIGKRRWFFALSLPITIPGVIFILLGFLTGGKVGLQFAIDFTGGTVWTIRFEDPNVTAEQVKGVLEEQGLEANVTKTGDRVHRDPDQGGRDRRARARRIAGAVGLAAPSGSVGRRRAPAASAPPSASSSAAASASPAPPPPPPRPPAASAAPSASPGASASPPPRRRASAAPARAPAPAPAACCRPGQARRGPGRARGRSSARSPSSAPCPPSAPWSRATSSSRP